MNAVEQKYNMMTQTSVERLVLTMAVPTILIMLVSALYNMADTYFVGQINSCGTSATAAIGISFLYGFLALSKPYGESFFIRLSVRIIPAHRKTGAQNTAGSTHGAAIYATYRYFSQPPDFRTYSPEVTSEA